MTGRTATGPGDLYHARMTELTSAITGYWDSAAAAFDDEPDHGLRAGRTRAAWDRLLRAWAPPARCRRCWPPPGIG